MKCAKADCKYAVDATDFCLDGASTENRDYGF